MADEILELYLAETGRRGEKREENTGQELPDHQHVALRHLSLLSAQVQGAFELHRSRGDERPKTPLRER